MTCPGLSNERKFSTSLSTYVFSHCVGKSLTEGDGGMIHYASVVQITLRARPPPTDTGIPLMRAAVASVLVACLMSAFIPTPTDAQKFEADLVIVNARVRTLDAARPTAEAVAVYGNRITHVGTSAEVRALAGPRTRVIDAKGALVLPGFNDAHVHFLSGGFQLSSVDLRDAATPQEFAERIRRFTEKLPKGRWITGGDWDHERWPNVNGAASLPTKELIDAFTPDRAGFVNRLDYHMALANKIGRAHDC